MVNDIIYEELIKCRNIKEFLDQIQYIIAYLVAKENCEDVVLAVQNRLCFFSDETCYGKPHFDTAKIHAEAAARYALVN